MNTQYENLTRECESILISSRDDYVQHEIWPTDVITINYLLTQRDAMKKIYCELAVLSSQQRAQFLEQLVSTLSFWSPEHAIEMRAFRNHLIDVNRKIGILAKELADLLDERSTLENEHPFSSNTHYHIAHIINEASRDNHLFRNYLDQPLQSLASQFDFKYWPDLPAILNVIANNADAADVNATDPRTEAATSSNRSSKADFLRAVLSMIDEINDTPGLGFPQGFRLSDSALADFVNVCLKLSADDLVDSTYVKNLRHRGKKSY